MKIILAAALIAATPALAFAQAMPSTQLGNSMGSDAAAQPHSHASDVASGGTAMSTGKSGSSRSMHHRSTKRRMTHTSSAMMRN